MLKADMKREDENSLEIMPEIQVKSEPFYRNHEKSKNDKGGSKRRLVKQSVFSAREFYQDQLRKLPNDYPTAEEIKGVYRKVHRYEVAVLSLFLHLDYFFEGLAEIAAVFEDQADKNIVQNSYSSIQKSFITKISRKAFDKNRSKENEIDRIRPLLSQILLKGKDIDDRSGLLEVYTAIPSRKKTFVEFIDYIRRLVTRIEAQFWDSKSCRVRDSICTYIGVDYSYMLHICELIRAVVELDFECKYYYKKPKKILKREIKDMKISSCSQNYHQEQGKKRCGMNPAFILKSIRYEALYTDTINQIFNAFSKQYLHYVVFIAKKYINSKVPFADIIQEGNMGLLKAVQKYNHKVGSKFISYAFYWIRQRISKAIADQSETIRLPVYIYHDYYQVKKVTQRLNYEPGKQPDIKSISSKAGRSEEKVSHLLRLFQQSVLSLNQEFKNNLEKSLVSYIPNTGITDPVLLLERETMKEEICCHVNHLPARELKIIEMRYGLNNGDKYTLEEVAKKFRVSRERIRQLEERALHRLKKNGRDRLEPYLYSNFRQVSSL